MGLALFLTTTGLKVSTIVSGLFTSVIRFKLVVTSGGLGLLATGTGLEILGTVTGVDSFATTDTGLEVLFKLDTGRFCTDGSCKKQGILRGSDVVVFVLESTSFFSKSVLSVED